MRKGGCGCVKFLRRPFSKFYLIAFLVLDVKAYVFGTSKRKKKTGKRVTVQ